MSEKKQDLVSSIVLLVFAGIFFYGAALFPSKDNIIAVLNAGFYPMMLAGILAFLSVLLLISSILKKEEGNTTTFWAGKKSVILFISVLACLIIYPFLMEFIGFGVTTFIFVASIIFLLSDKEEKTPVLSLIVAFGITIIIYLIFKIFLGIPFPSGLLI